MSVAFTDRTFQSVSQYWHNIPPPYRNPVLSSSAAVLLLTPIAWRRLTYTPKLLTPPSKDYKFTLSDLADDTSATFTLSSGRKIGYATHGAPQGKPVFNLHGLPGSRLEGALMHNDAKALGLWMITVERPGIGLSDPWTNASRDYTLFDHAADVQALAEHLDLESYAVLGTSGGGPYALACAAALPKEKLKAVTIVTGLGLPDMSQAWPKSLVWLNRKITLRWLIKWILSRAGVYDLSQSDEERFEVLRQRTDLNKMHKRDVEVTEIDGHRDWMMLFVKSAREAIRQGWKGTLDDAKVLYNVTDLRVENIRADLPVRLWCGTDDQAVSYKASGEMADRLRGVGNKDVALHVHEGDTHGSTQVFYRKEYLQDLATLLQK